MKKKQRLVFDIISYVFIGIALTLALLGIIVKANNGTIYLFDIRADVVLSDSMSEKNAKYIDFLKGHDDQIQKLDLVFSKKVNSETELNVYDIVLFNNPGIGTTVHRIVGKEEKRKDVVRVEKPIFTTLDGVDVIQLNEIDSSIETNVTSYQNVEIELYSTNTYDERYNFYTGTSSSVVKVETTTVGEYYLHKISIKRDTSAPSQFLISHKDYRDYSGDYFASISIDSTYGNILLTPNKLSLESGGKYVYNTNVSYQYEIRGDKAPNSDGKFGIEDIYSKVTWTFPKAGYFIRYITSIYGVILLVGVSVILITTQFLLEYLDKKNKKESQEKEKLDEEK